MVNSEKKSKPDDELGWDKKKILGGILVLFILFLAGFYVKGSFFPDTDVKGASIYQPKVSKDITDTISKDVPVSLGNSIENIKQNAENLNVADVASSSPQVQKILNDLKALQDYPKNQAREACINICNRL